MNELSWLEIDLTAIDHNVAWWRSLLTRQGSKSTQLCVVAKANAYGLGAPVVALRLEAAGADMIAVYSTLQAQEIFDAGAHGPLLVLNPCGEVDASPSPRSALLEHRLHLAANDPGQLEQIESVGHRLGCTVPVHLHLDTGMSRSGLSRREFDQCLEHLEDFPHLELAGLFTHLATAHCDGSLDHEQLHKYDAALEANARTLTLHPQALRHIAASGGTCRGKAFIKDMVRVGLGIYGYATHGLTGETDIPIPGAPRPVLRWRAKITHVANYKAGDGVGYGRTFVLDRDSVLGVVPAGYADGYSLALSSKGRVRVLVDAMSQPSDCRVLGRVSMDQFVIDLTDVPGVGRTDLKRSAIVELISTEPDSPCTLPKVAQAAGSSLYETMCRLSPRLPRRYMESPPGR